jgi:hypothetical protein
MRCPDLFVLVFVFVLVCADGEARAQTPSQVPKADTETWNDLQLTIPLTRQVDFLVQGTVRIGGNLTTPVDERWGFGFNYKAQKYITLNELYFHREATPPNGRHEYEDRLSFGATLNIPVGRFTLVNRNWFERRWRHPQVDAWRYRDRVRLEHPFKLHKQQFTYFVSDEVFYDWSLHDWVRNRFGVGANHAFNKHFTLEVYGMRQNDGRTRPGDINIMGTVMRFRL